MFIKFSLLFEQWSPKQDAEPLEGLPPTENNRATVRGILAKHSSHVCLLKLYCGFKVVCGSL